MKSKRKNNLFKKSCELEKMFDLDVCLIIRDRECNKVYQFKSGDEQIGYFDIEVAHNAVNCQIDNRRMKTAYNEISNKFYDRLSR